MGDLFSSPSKQAAHSSSAVQGINQQEITQYEQYVAQQEAAARAAIGQQTNPYFTASAQMNPSGYAVNPKDVVDFGSNGIHTPNTPTPKPARQTPHPVLPPPGVLGNNPTPPPTPPPVRA